MAIGQQGPNFGNQDAASGGSGPEARLSEQRRAWSAPSVAMVDVVELTTGSASGPVDGITIES